MPTITTFPLGWTTSCVDSTTAVAFPASAWMRAQEWAKFRGGALASLQSTYDRVRADDLFHECLPDVADWCDHCDEVIGDPGPSGHGGAETTSP